MSREHSRRRALAALGATAVSALAGCASVVEQASESKQTPNGRSTATARDTATPGTTTPQDATGTGNSSAGTPTEEPWSIDEVTIEPPAFGLDSVPLPDTDTRATYATMGTADADATATVYGNWKCPYTREFVRTQLPGIVDEFVRPGDVNIRFRALAYRAGEPFLGPDAPRAARAGLAVWNADPDTYWSYFAYVFANQPAERHAWAKPDLLVRLAEAAGVNSPPEVRRALTSTKFADPVAKTVSDAKELGVWSVPRLAYDGTVTAPTLAPERSRELLEEAAEE